LTVEKRFRISLDIKRSTSNRDFEVVEGDNGNLLEVTLTDDGVPVDLTGCRVSAIFSKSDGHTAEQNTDGSGITLDPQQKDRLVIQLYNTSVAPGLVECELQVFSGEGYGTLVTSAKFNFMCRRGIANADTIKSTDEWPLLTGLIQQVRQMEEQTKVLNTATAEAAGAANAAAGTARELQQAVSLAELERREQEEARILNETARDVAEEDRELAEQERQELSAVATMAANTAAEQAKNAADRANEAADRAEELVSGNVPTHANTHQKGGSDEITLAMLGAAAKTVSVAVTLLADGWTGDGPYEQTISVAHLTGSRFENPDVFPEFTEDIEAEREAWSHVDQVVSAEGALQFTCLAEAPGMDLTLIVKVRD